MLKIIKTIIKWFYLDYAVVSYKELAEHKAHIAERARAKARQEILDEQSKAGANKYKAEMAKIFEAQPTKPVSIRIIN